MKGVNNINETGNNTVASDTEKKKAGRAVATVTKEEAGKQSVDTDVSKKETGKQSATAGVSKKEAVKQSVDTDVSKKEAGKQSATAGVSKKEAIKQSVDTDVSKKEAGKQSATATVSKKEAGKQSVDTDVSKKEAGKQSVDIDVSKKEAGKQSATADVSKKEADKQSATATKKEDEKLATVNDAFDKLTAAIKQKKDADLEKKRQHTKEYMKKQEFVYLRLPAKNEELGIPDYKKMVTGYAKRKGVSVNSLLTALVEKELGIEIRGLAQLKEDAKGKARQAIINN